MNASKGIGRLGVIYFKCGSWTPPPPEPEPTPEVPDVVEPDVEEGATTDNEDVAYSPNPNDYADGTREEGKDEEEEEESLNDDDNDTGMADE